MQHQVGLLDYEIKDYNRDPVFSRLFQQKLGEGEYELVFSFNFIPLIAKLALAAKIRYVSWIYDAMPLTHLVRTIIFLHLTEKIVKS